MSIRLVCGLCLICIVCDAQEFTLTQYTTIHGLPQMRISSLASDSLGYIWIGSEQNGVAAFDGRTFKTYSTRDGLLSNSVESIKSTSTGIWVAHAQGITHIANGQLSVSRSDKAPIVVKGTVALPPSLVYINNNIFSVGTNGEPGRLIMRDVIVNQAITDGLDRIWIATEGAGLVKLMTKNWSLFRMRGVLAVDKSRDGQIWFGSYLDGLWRIKDIGLSTQQVVKVADVKVIDIHYDNDKLWCASEEGLGFIENNNFKPILNETVYAMTSDSQNTLWCATPDGLLAYSNGSVHRRNISKLTFVYHWRARNSLFFGDATSLYTMENRKPVKVNISGIEKTPINCLTSYGDSLLVVSTSGGGLFFINDKFHVVRSFTTKDGLPSNFITFADVDQAGDFWIGTNLGISQLKFDELLNVVSVIDQPPVPGVNSMESMTNSYYLKDAKLFGLNDGLFCLTESTEKKMEYAPHITLLKTAKQSVSFPGNNRHFVIESDEKEIEIHFNKIGGSGFSYRMLPMDKEWHQATIGTVITYPVIEPGENTFMVRALTNEGKWSQSLNLLISIKPRFHQTVPFRIAIGALVILVVVVIIYWVMRAKAARLLRMEFERQESNARIRKEIARDFHDETGNQLSLIITYSSLLRSRKDRPVSDITLQQIEESAQKLYYGTKDFIWSIDPVNDEVSNLFIHIRDLGEKLFETTSTTFRAINSVTESIQLPIGTSRQISLIFREAMNNAFKYASAKNVTFTVSVSETEVQCGIEDDGVGFDFNDLKKTSGLDNMRFRAARMKAQMDMDSFPGKGTTIILRYAR